MPERPANVSFWAPMATPSRAISVIPRVIRGGFGVVPQAQAVQGAAARAITFFSAPPSSTPTTSSLT